MYESDDEQTEKLFYYHEGNNNKKNNIENDDSMTDLALRARSVLSRRLSDIFQ